MPNKWTKATQAIYEFFNGPRTVDTEFNLKVEELNSIMNSMKTITTIIKNFPNQTMGLKNFCESIYNNLKESYKGNSIYIPFIIDVCDSHKKIETSYLNLCENINKIQKGNLEWKNKFDEVQNSLINREEARKVYDHYDEKMEKLVKDRNNKLSKGENEDIKDIEKFERNDGKYKKAASDFIQMSNYSYRIIQDLLDYRYQILNPIICNLVNEEKIFFDSCSNFFSKFGNVTQKMEGLNKGFQKSPINYDGAKYCRASRLLQGLNPSSLPQIKKKEKYSYENYQNRNNNNNMNNNNNNSNNFNNNNFQKSNIINMNNYNNNGYYEESGFIIGGKFQSNNNNNNNYNQINNNVNGVISNKNNTPNDNNHQFSYDDYVKKTKSLQQTSFNNQNNDNNNTSTFNFNNTSNIVNTTTFNFGNNDNKNQKNNPTLPQTKPINDFNFGMINKNTYDFDQQQIFNPYGNIDLNHKNTMNYENNFNFSMNNNNNNNNMNNNNFSQGNNNSNMNNFGDGFNF